MSCIQGSVWESVCSCLLAIGITLLLVIQQTCELLEQMLRMINERLAALTIREGARVQPDEGEGRPAPAPVVVEEVRRRAVRPRPAEERRHDVPAVGEYHAVAVGRRVGVFLSWEEARSYVDGHRFNKHQRFSSRQAAERYLVRMLQSPKVSEENRAILRRALVTMGLQYTHV